METSTNSSTNSIIQRNLLSEWKMFDLTGDRPLRALPDFILAFLIGLCLLFSLLLPFNMGWEGAIVEVNPISWVILSLGMAYVLIRTKNSRALACPFNWCKVVIILIF